MLCGKCATHLLDVVSGCPACGSNQILPDSSLTCCPECGDKLTDVASNCPGCAVAPALGNLRVCPGCAAVIAKTLKFCWSCGQRQVDSQPATPIRPSPEIPSVPTPALSRSASPEFCPACGEALSGEARTCHSCGYDFGTGRALPCTGCGVLVADSLTFCWSCGERQGGVPSGVGKPPAVPGLQPRPNLANEASGVPKSMPAVPPLAKPLAPGVSGKPATGSPAGAGPGKPPLPSSRPMSPVAGTVALPQTPPVPAQPAEGMSHTPVSSAAPASKKPLWIFGTVAALVVLLGVGWAGYNWFYRGIESNVDVPVENSGAADPLSPGASDQVPEIPETAESGNQGGSDLPDSSPPGKSSPAVQTSPPGRVQTPSAPRQPDTPARGTKVSSQDPVRTAGRGSNSPVVAEPPEVEVLGPSSKAGSGIKSAGRNEDSSQVPGAQDDQSPAVAVPIEPVEPIKTPVESTPSRGESRPGDVAPQVPAPSNPPAAPPPYAGPLTGTIVWRGTVEKGAEVVIENGRASIGEITGGLPGVACMISLSDPSVAVSQAPGPGNKYGRLVLRFAKKSKQAVAINWEVIR